MQNKMHGNRFGSGLTHLLLLSLSQCIHFVIVCHLKNEKKKKKTKQKLKQTLIYNLKKTAEIYNMIQFQAFFFKFLLFFSFEVIYIYICIISFK